MVLLCVVFVHFYPSIKINKIKYWNDGRQNIWLYSAFALVKNFFFFYQKFNSIRVIRFFVNFFLCTKKSWSFGMLTAKRKRKTLWGWRFIYFILLLVIESNWNPLNIFFLILIKKQQNNKIHCGLPVTQNNANNNCSSIKSTHK